jgi:dihydroorotate dehydrogenase electron transfer subunit
MTPGTASPERAPHRGQATAALHAPQNPGQRRGRFLATVTDNVRLCREHNRLTFRIQGFPASLPGQFVQVKCRDVDSAPLGLVCEREMPWQDDQPAALADSKQPDLHQPTPLLRRPFSIAGRRSTPQGEEIDLINRDIGPGTRWLYHLEVGQEVDLIGPLGNAFALPEPGGMALLVGGGVGIPPMIYIAQALAELNSASAGERRGAVAFCGALSLDLMPLTLDPPAATGEASAGPRMNVLEFSRFGFETVLSTDDGSYGHHGRITGALEAFLDRPPAREGPPPTIYTCGPEAMMKAVAAIARERGLRCQVAVERAMACGMGTCQSCVIRQVDAGDRGWRYRLACTDGPVFEASSLLW